MLPTAHHRLSAAGCLFSPGLWPAVLIVKRSSLPRFPYPDICMASTGIDSPSNPPLRELLRAHPVEEQGVSENDVEEISRMTREKEQQLSTEDAMALAAWVDTRIAYSLQMAIRAAAGILPVSLFRLRLPPVALTTKSGVCGIISPLSVR